MVKLATLDSRWELKTYNLHSKDQTMVETGFYLLTVIMLFTPLVIFNKTSESNKLITRYIFGLIIWLGYVTTISSLGLLGNFDLPPRMPLMVVIPIIIIILIVTSRPFFKEALQKVPSTFSIYIQSFRIVVELLIYGTYLKGIFPKASTFEGLNY